MSRDLLVVGGGPAGLFTAIAARRRGLAVTVIDRRRPPLDKACGEGLMPDAVRRLEEAGVELGGAPRPFRGIRFVDGELAAEGRFLHGAGAGVRRIALHAALVERARALGVELRWGTTALGPSPEGVLTPEGLLRSRWTAGADGLHSRVRRWSGLHRPPGRRGRTALRAHFAAQPWCELVEVHWGPGVEACVTPVGPREVGVAFTWSGGPATLDSLLTALPALRRRLAGAPLSSRPAGAGPLDQRAAAVVAGRTLLVGDAAGFLDCLSGEGLAVAFHQAEALAEALSADRPESYARAHRRIVRARNAVTRLLLLAVRRPALRRRALRGLAADPELFSRLLSVQGGEPPRRVLSAGHGARFLRCLLPLPSLSNPTEVSP